jgi:hypothetical protein
MADCTIVQINQIGRMGNHMAQLMFATALQRRCRRRIEIEGFKLPDWHLSVPKRHPCHRPDISVGSHLTRVNQVAALIEWLKPDSLSVDGVIIRTGNFLPPEEYETLFPLEADEGLETPADAIIINIRSGDISTPTHPDYGPLPISYYEHLLAHTGLRPIFMGELDDTPYCHALRETFPDAAFLPSMGVRGDFQTVRRARNIAISVSSFSWMAAFLSRSTHIHVPVAGMLDPRCRPDVDMLPLDDQRFTYHDISSAAWNERYTSYFPSANSFSVLSRSSVAALKRSAIKKSAILCLRIHAGLARRMLRSSQEPQPAIT